MQSVDVTLESYSALVDTLLDELPKSAGQATVLALQGDLGAGKTTLTQAIAVNLGVVETVTSPTFVIQKIYQTNDGRWSQLVHIDAYRIEDYSELGPLRFVELLQEPDTLIVIEWPEHIVSALPVDATTLRLSTVDEATRRIEPVSLTNSRV